MGGKSIQKCMKAFSDVKFQDFGETSSRMAPGSHQQGLDFYQIDQVVDNACIPSQEQEYAALRKKKLRDIHLVGFRSGYGFLQLDGSVPMAARTFLTIFSHFAWLYLNLIR